MPIATSAIPYGLRDIKLQALSADGTTTSGSLVDLPASRTFSFSDTAETTELRGDDKVVAARTSDTTVDWELEGGGISLEAYAVMAGGLVTTTGITPAVKKQYRKLVNDNRPYFKVEGQSINDNGGDFHCIVYRCKADGSLDGSMTDQEFLLTSASGKGYSSLQAATIDAVYDFVHNETAVAIA